jgi:hypothetical protein
LQHAGEIYGEKAILATELKELQSRLSSLSGERDESLAILDEVLNLLFLLKSFSSYFSVYFFFSFQNK